MMSFLARSMFSAGVQLFSHNQDILQPVCHDAILLLAIINLFIRDIHLLIFHDDAIFFFPIIVGVVYSLWLKAPILPLSRCPHYPPSILSSPS